MRSVADQLADMSVSEIESINVIKYGGSALYGARGGNGIIIVKTRNGRTEESAKKTLDRDRLQVVKIAGFSTVTDFYSPDYSDANYAEGSLDTRSTIYWNPNIVTNGKEPLQISFFAADLPTHYRVIVEGIDANGQVVRGEKIFTVVVR
jgi:TonB-dependent SusC/RagA subfamily outer membrane receptor